MKKIIIALFCAFHFIASAQQQFTAPVPHWSGAPIGTPSTQGARVRYDQTAGKWYFWNGSTWLLQPDGVAQVSGLLPPAYTPGVGQSHFAINAANELYRWRTGTIWDCLNCAGAVEPVGQVLYGTGTGTDSDERFKWVASPTGNGIEVKARQTSTTNNPNANEVWTVYDPNPLAGNIPNNKKFGRWYNYTLYDPDMNLLGNSTDTTGNMIHIRGFNLGGADNALRGAAWWQSEQCYALPTTGLFGKWSIEEQFNVRDTFGRIQRPINMAYAYDGSRGGLSFEGHYTSWFKPNSGQSLAYLWDFDQNKYTIFDTVEIAIANSMPGRFLSKQEFGGTNPLNVVTQKSDNSFIIGDIRGIEVMDTLRLKFASTQNGGTFTALGVNSVQLDAAFKIKTTNDRMLSFEKTGIVSPADWQIRVDPTDIFSLNRNASTPILSMYKDAVSDLFTLRQDKVSIGQGFSIPSRLSVFQATDDQNGAIAIVNTARSRQWRQFIEAGLFKIRAASTNNTVPVLVLENTTTGNQLFVSNAVPEAAITASPGDIVLANESNTGRAYVKRTGTGNTGYSELLQRADAYLPDRSRMSLIEGDCMAAGTGQTFPGLIPAAVSAGAIANVTATGAHPGLIALRDGTTANGGYTINTNAAALLLQGGERCSFVFQDRNTTTRATSNIRLGFFDSFTSTAPTDGAFIQIQGGVLTGICRNNNTQTATATTFPVAQNTWYSASVEVISASLVRFTVFSEAGAQLWTADVTTNIPTGSGRETGFGMFAFETTTDAAADIVWLDYYKFDIDRILIR